MPLARQAPQRAKQVREAPAPGQQALLQGPAERPATEARRARGRRARTKLARVLVEPEVALAAPGLAGLGLAAQARGAPGLAEVERVVPEQGALARGAPGLAVNPGAQARRAEAAGALARVATQGTQARVALPRAAPTA